MAAGATARVGGGRIGGRARYVIGTCRLAAVQSRLPSLRVRGLMTLALFAADPDRDGQDLDHESSRVQGPVSDFDGRAAGPCTRLTMPATVRPPHPRAPALHRGSGRWNVTASSTACR